MITMYELLGLVKDGKAPMKIKGRLNRIYTFNRFKNDYVDSDGKFLFLNLTNFRDKCLDEQVEILEKEKKIPEKLNWVDYNIEFTQKNFNKEFRIICNTIDEIIDYLDYLKSKGDE